MCIPKKRRSFKSSTYFLSFNNYMLCTSFFTCSSVTKITKACAASAAQDTLNCSNEFTLMGKKEGVGDEAMLSAEYGRMTDDSHFGITRLDGALGGVEEIVAAEEGCDKEAKDEVAAVSEAERIEARETDFDFCASANTEEESVLLLTHRAREGKPATATRRWRNSIVSNTTETVIQSSTRPKIDGPADRLIWRTSSRTMCLITRHVFICIFQTCYCHPSPFADIASNSSVEQSS